MNPIGMTPGQVPAKSEARQLLAGPVPTTGGTGRFARPGSLFGPAETEWDDNLPVPPSRRPACGILVAFANVMVVLDMTIANVSLPHIAGDMGATLDQGTWVITSYAVAEAICVPLTGWLTQRFGTVRMFMIAMTGFGLFSLLCGLSVTLPMLVACRIGQGVFGGLIMPLSQSMMSRLYKPELLPAAMARWSLTIGLAPAFGPVVGGFISDQISWHWIFLINVPIAMVAVPLAHAWLRPAETVREKRDIDKWGMALLVLWIGALQIMLDLGRDRDWFADPLILGLGLVALVGFGVFVIWELTEEHPAVDIRIFRHFNFAMSVLSLALGQGAYFAGVVAVPQWLQTTMGYSATSSGLVTAVAAISGMMASQVVLRIMLKVDPRVLASFGAAWLGSTLLLRLAWTPQTDGMTMAWMLFLHGFGMPFIMMPLSSVALSLTSPDEIPSAAGLQSFVRTMASAVATALVLTAWHTAEIKARAPLAGSLHMDNAMADLGRAGLPEPAALSYISNLLDQQTMTLGLLAVTKLTAISMFLSAMVVWTMPRVELTRFKSNRQLMDH
ncbi:DHA2 family efflux MFS transporter permease subunit [Novosphingobium bradum]|uniref:DHA2 family efflux MFS transporter permease subunit n=1 Tax=Novosphingobium bradum TaxID=1737444 RepID=A0ABV7IVA4_9SPHN